MAFTHKLIDLEFQLGQGTFGLSGMNTVRVSGLRVQVSITTVQGVSLGQASVKVYGLTPSLMNQLYPFIKDQNQYVGMVYNNIIIYAGDDNGMQVIFQGQITQAGTRITMPDSAFEVEAHAGAFQAVQVIPPSSYPGPANVANIMQNLANLGRLQFFNNGVSVILPSTYLYGSLGEQIRRARLAANINAVIDNGALWIWPLNGTRVAAQTIISAEKGMIGYPSVWPLLAGGVDIRTLFNSTLIPGSVCEVISTLSFANGLFKISRMSHELESQTPNGKWETHIFGAPYV